MDRAKIDQIYQRLKLLKLDLPRDPGSLGPEFLREQISICRNYLNETAHYLQEVLEEETYLSIQCDSAEATFQIRSTELLASDPRVTSRPNIADRQAMVDMFLRNEKQEILRIQQALRALKHVRGVVKHRHKELDNTMSSIRLQRSLLRDALKTGAFYGDETEKSRGKVDPADSLNGDDLEALLASSEAELEQERAAAASQPPEESEDLEETEEEPAPPAAPVVTQKQPAPLPDLPIDPVDDMGGDELAALLGDEVAKEEPPQPVEQLSEESMNEALNRFLEEPSDDIESIIAAI